MELVGEKCFTCSATHISTGVSRHCRQSGGVTGVDNLTVSTSGDVFVAEDGGDLQIVAFATEGAVVPIVQLVGHGLSEITGPAFDPSGTRLYFSSQRGQTGHLADGITFEVSGPFV